MSDTSQNAFTRRSPRAKAAIATIVAIVVLALAALIYFGTQSAKGPEATGNAGGNASGGGAGKISEQISDDATPMASGLTGAETVALAPESTDEPAVETPMNIYPIFLENTKGDCTLLESNGEYLLMDLGTASAYPVIKSTLESLGVQKLSVYISHFHNDHTGGLSKGEGFEALMNDFDVEKVYLPSPNIDTVVDHTWHYNKVASYVTSANSNANGSTEATKAIYLKVGDTFTVGSVNAKVIGPVKVGRLTKPSNPANRESRDTKAWENNTSLATMFTFNGTRFLTTGDIETEEEMQLAAAYGGQLKADIFKLGHHGYASSNDAEFLRLIQPVYSFAQSSCQYTSATEVKTDDAGQQYLGIRKPVATAKKYGIVYLTGLEQRTARITVNLDGTFEMSRLGDSAFNGWTRLYGAAGYLKGFSSGDNWRNNYVASDKGGAPYSWYYILANGKPDRGMRTIGGKVYNFGTGGAVEQGSWSVANGKASYSGWKKTDQESGSSYVMRYYKANTSDAPGTMYVGMQKIGSNYYYFDPTSGARTAGIVKIDSDKYLFGNDGIMKSNYGFMMNGKNLYATSTGQLAKGLLTRGSDTYYYDKNCYRVGGKVLSVGSKYYRFGNDGKMWKNRMFLIGKKRYYATSNGPLVVNKAKTVRGVTYLFGKDGVAMTGTAKGKIVKFKGKKYKLYASGRAVLL